MACGSHKLYPGRFVKVTQFRYLNDYSLIRKRMLENFPIYLQSYNENHSSIFNKLNEYRHKKRTVYSAKCPLEKRFGQYRKMSGEIFLIRLRDAIPSNDKIIKIKVLFKKEINRY